MYIFLVTALGFLLRIINIVKPEGLWNDEYVSWLTASVPFGEGFLNAVMKQCHMPFYYFYLKPFCNYNDTILRLTSLIPSVAAIPVMYFLGKEFSDKCGRICAIVTAILPFSVYYSQEVRFYSLLFFISACLLLYLVRAVKHNSKKNVILFGLFSILLVSLHVLGIFYSILCTTYYLYKKKKLSMPVIISALICVLAALPFGINILSQIPAAQWWGKFSYTNILFMFTDFFSPILTNNINAPGIFFYGKTLIYNLLLVIPALIACFGVIIAVKNHKGIFCIAAAFTVLAGILASCGVIVFITKYITEILPVLILLMSDGLARTEFKHTGNILLGIYITINLLAIYTPYYPSLKVRQEGNRLPAIVINEQRPDVVVYTYYAPDRFDRYVKYSPRTYHISKINRFQYFNNSGKILDNVNSGENVSIVFLDSVSFIPEDLIEKSIENGLPEMFVTFSKLRYELSEAVRKKCSSYDYTKIGAWTVLNCRGYRR